MTNKKTTLVKCPLAFSEHGKVVNQDTAIKDKCPVCGMSVGDEHDYITKARADKWLRNDQ